MLDNLLGNLVSIQGADNGIDATSGQACEL